MADLSDDDIYSDDEEIDLEALWRDPPFINMENEEHPEDTTTTTDADSNSSKVIDLLPMNANGEFQYDDNIENLINDLNILTRIVSQSGSTKSDRQSADFAHRLEVARQRILNLKNSSETPEEPQSSSVTQNKSKLSPVYKSKLSKLSENTMEHRYRQVQPSRTKDSAPSSYCTKETFASAIPVYSHSSNSEKPNEKEATTSQFILPGELKRRENKYLMKKRVLRADKAVFVTNLLFSSLAKHAENVETLKAEIYKKYGKYPDNMKKEQ